MRTYNLEVLQYFIINGYLYFQIPGLLRRWVQSNYGCPFVGGHVFMATTSW